METAKKKKALVRDLIIIALSVGLGVILMRTQGVEAFLASLGPVRWLTNLAAGAFFSSIFTTFPAIVALGELARTGPLLATALLGGLGALLADLLMFRFFRDEVSKVLADLFYARENRLARLAHEPSLRWLMPFLGALIIASPLPDELGIFVLGLSRMPTMLFIPLSFTMNFLGILAVGAIARTL